MNNRVQYLVVWKDYPGEDSCAAVSALAGCKDAINEFERTYFPPHCVKRKDEVCSCGDTGCEGPEWLFPVVAVLLQVLFLALLQAVSLAVCSAVLPQVFARSKQSFLVLIQMFLVLIQVALVIVPLARG